MPAVLVYLTLGIAWTGRSLLGVIANPDYWEPVTVVDHAAVWSYSVALALVALATLILVRDAGAGRLATGCALVVAAAALSTAVANGVEDGIGLKSWGTVYVAGALGMLVGLVAFAIALWADGRRHYSVAVWLWAAGILTLTWGLGFLVLVGSVVAIYARRRPVLAAA